MPRVADSSRGKAARGQPRKKEKESDKKMYDKNIKQKRGEEH